MSVPSASSAVRVEAKLPVARIVAVHVELDIRALSGEARRVEVEAVPTPLVAVQVLTDFLALDPRRERHGPVASIAEKEIREPRIAMDFATDWHIREAQPQRARAAWVCPQAAPRSVFLIVQDRHADEEFLPATVVALTRKRQVTVEPASAHGGVPVERARVFPVARSVARF